MKTLLKSLIVWLMLLAVPFQGFASATMLMCAPLQAAAHAGATQHDHAAMLAAPGGGQAHHASAAAGDAAPAGHHASGKCNACAICCFGASMAPSQFAALPVETQNFPIPTFDAGFVPDVDLALPERPPKSLLS